VNTPSVDPEVFEMIRPYLELAERMGSLQAQLSVGNLCRIALEYHGEVLRDATSPMTAAFLKGAIGSLSEDPVSYVNAPLFAQKRGVTIDEIRKSDHQDYANLMNVQFETSEGTTSISGTVFGSRDPRVIRIDDFEVKARLEGPMLICCNRDVPGVVGRMGTTLADADLNISDMALGRESRGGRAIMLINLDSPVSDEILERIAGSPNLVWAKRAVL
jgi:D-3-phosphoglycerate dehydrogenase